MNARTFRLILLISCCHALLHVFELSFPAVEQLVGEEFSIGTATTGKIGTAFRLPFGLAAILAGWMADRFGAKRLLLLFLVGCGGASVMAFAAPNVGMVTLSMVLMGGFASIYHPAGVGLISHHTSSENRTLALGYHGIFGSIGIATAPFLAAGVLMIAGTTWRHYFLHLGLPAMLLAGLVWWRLSRDNGSAGASPSRRPATRSDSDAVPASIPESPDSGSAGASPSQPARWDCFVILIATVTMLGFVYAAVMNFLPRYLPGEALEAWVDSRNLTSVGADNLLAGGVLLLGVFGQYASGRLARPTTLELLMACTLFALIPILLWMGLAEGPMRLAAAACFAPLFFAHQPLYNSLVAKYVPRGRRSLAYGMSFTAGFGFGSFGSTFAGYQQSAFVTHATLAGFMGVACVLTVVLWRRVARVQRDRRC